MSQSNFQLTHQLITTYYNYFNAKDYEGMLSLLSQDVIHEINQGHAETGVDKFKKFLASMDFHYDENLTQIEVAVSQSGQTAAAEFICNGIYKNSAEGLPVARKQKYSIAVGTFFKISDGKILRVTNYYNLNNWIAQVSK